MSQSNGYRSLRRGLDILTLVQDAGRLRPGEVSEKLGIPLSTVYRYAHRLCEGGFLNDFEGYLAPTARLSEPSSETHHLVRSAESVLRDMRNLTGMTAVLAVRIHTAAVCLEHATAHPAHRVTFQCGHTRTLAAGGSALPLLAYAPPAVIGDVLDGELRAYTAATPNRAEVEAELARIRTRGYAVSHGHLTPGMSAIGVPVLLDGRCLCSLSLVGEDQQFDSIDDALKILRAGSAELLSRMPANTMREAGLSPER